MRKYDKRILLFYTFNWCHHYTSVKWQFFKGIYGSVGLLGLTHFDVGLHNSNRTKNEVNQNTLYKTGFFATEKLLPIQHDPTRSDLPMWTNFLTQADPAQSAGKHYSIILKSKFCILFHIFYLCVWLYRPITITCTNVRWQNIKHIHNTECDYSLS